MKKTLVFIALFALVVGTASVAHAQVGYGGRGSGRSGDFRNRPTLPGQASPTAVAAVGKVLGASTFNFGSNLSLGSRGQDVVELQNRLRAEGLFSADSTGYFGPLTRDAVMAYQRAHGINPTGFVGPLSLARLNASAGLVLGASTNSGVGSTRVTELRNQLSAAITSLIQLLQLRLNALR